MQIKGLQNAGMLKRNDKHARLREARSRIYRTAKEAATALGIPYGTYSGHESGSRGFDAEEASRYGRFFRVRTDWLLFGNGNSEELRLRPLAGSLGRGGIIDFTKTGLAAHEQPNVLLDCSVSDAAVVYQIQDYELTPWFQKGSALVCGYRQRDQIDIDGKLVVFSLDGTGAQLGTIICSDNTEGFDVECFGAPNLRLVRPKWIEEVLVIVPFRQWSMLSMRNKQEPSPPLHRRVIDLD